LAYRTMAKKRRTGLANLAMVMPEASEERHREIIRQCFEHYGSYLLEMISIERFSSQELRNLTKIEGLEQIEALEKDPRGYYITSGHYGSWEMGICSLASYIGEVQAVTNPADNPGLDEARNRVCAQFGVRLIGRKGSVIKMLAAHRRGERSAIMIDQRLRARSGGVQACFFGRLAWTSPILGYLSISTGAVVVHVTCVPDGADGYLLRVRPPIEPAGEGPEAQLLMTERYLKLVEEDIRERPELWLWMYRRWHD